jgi:hypothetical protein
LFASTALETVGALKTGTEAPTPPAKMMKLLVHADATVEKRTLVP